MSNFPSYILGVFEIDVEFELYYQAWIVYHTTANRIDGHIKRPRNKEELKLIQLAAREAQYMQKSFLKECGVLIYHVDRKKWNRAKLQAIRNISE